ncbi:hypothetical protein BDV12DRAFT_175019 [Aspergillus spectabilis]
MKKLSQKLRLRFLMFLILSIPLEILPHHPLRRRLSAMARGGYVPFARGRQTPRTSRPARLSRTSLFGQPP